MNVAPIEVEVHVYWKGKSVDRAVFVHAGKETEIPLCTEIRRTVKPGGPPLVEVQVVGRLIEHREP